MGYSVYFDGKSLEAEQKAVFGVVVEDADMQSTFLTETEIVNIDRKLDAYDVALFGWKYALGVLKDYVEEFEDEEIVFVNQQELIFKWASNGKYPLARENYYESIRDRLVAFIEYDCAVSYRAVKPSENKAKKLVQQEIKKQKLNTKSAGELGNLMKQVDAMMANKKKSDKKETKNVLEFKKKA